jgi:hypothetical protein
MSNPRRRRRTARKANPRRTRRAAASTVRYSNPRRRHHRARRRNPIGMNASKPMELFTPALVGALGATAVNTVLGQIGGILPSSFTTGNMTFVTRAALSLGLAMFAPHAGSKKAAVLQMAEGSLTVVLHDAIVSLSAGMGMPLAGMGVYMPGRVQQAPNAWGRPAVQMNGMGAYLSGDGSPAARIQMARQQARARSAPVTRGSMAGFGFN